MKLYFKNSQGNLRVIAEPTSDKECFAAIKQFLDEYGFKSHYTRVYLDSNTNRKIYDVGSWSERFELEGYEENDDYE